MGRTVSKLTINQQAGSDAYYASWSFDPNTTTPSSNAGSGTVKAGDWVKVKAGATWAGGVSIASFVFGLEWYVESVSGNTALLTKDRNNQYNIISRIEVKYLTGGTGGGSTGTTKQNTLDHFEVKWEYKTANNVWFGDDSPSTTTRYNSTYSAPDNAIQIRVSVKPVSKTYKEGDNEKSYWSGATVTAYRTLSIDAPEKPPTPSVEIEQFTLTATVTGISDTNTAYLHFEIYDKGKRVKTGKVPVYTSRASFTCDVAAGGSYVARCRGENTNGALGDWSDYSSDEKETVPNSVAKVTCVADSKTSAKLTWPAVANAREYEIRYAKNKSHFDSSSGVSSMRVTNTTAYVTGLETGQEWFFQIRAINDQGESSWSTTVSTVIGSEPEAPTTWSLTSTAVVGDKLYIYWTHNTEDGSRQSKAEIQLNVDGNTSSIIVPGTPVEDEDEEEAIYFYELDSTKYSDGAIIKWRVRTMGITGEYSDWSTQREIKLYAPPTLSMDIGLDATEGSLTRLPLVVVTYAGPTNQTPMSYHVSVVAKNSYETVDITGRQVAVIAGTEVFSKVYHVSDRVFTAPLGAGDIILDRFQYYELTVTVSMDSGLTATATEEFYVDWDEYEYIPDAAIGIDQETLTAHITPYCLDADGSIVNGVLLSVYRREANGKLTQIAANVANTWVDTVVDPHPSLDYARYRIIAQHVDTGAVSFTDISGLKVGESAIVIQWDEEWSSYDYTDGVSMEAPPWSGSMLRLRYNIDVSESYSPDVEFIEYIGREHPVDYFGTQRGETATWSTVIPVTDKETLYALRRLAAWNGNAYVREPSGIGYWAHVQVGISIKHLDLTIPVTFNITRVEGGM